MQLGMTELPDHIDITIIGGGPVGALTALRLAQSGHRVLLVEAREEVREDPRILALSWGSVQALQKIGAWQEAGATAIRTVHISQENSIGRTRLEAEALKVPALGYVIRYGDLARQMQAGLKQSTISCAFATRVKEIRLLRRYARLTLQTGDRCHLLTSRLVILADGGPLTEALGIERHIKDYRQVAITSTVEIEAPHQQIAYERFAHDGPLALLPYQRGFALVWTQSPETAARRLALDDTAFLDELYRRFKGRAPQLTGIGQRFTFPLTLKSLKYPLHLPRIALIGNAAQTLHPVAGQGLNLGFRDAMTLTRLLYSTPAKELGEPQMLHRYYAQRRTDTTLTQGFTDLLVECFSPDRPQLRGLRSAGLTLLDQHPFLKQQFGKKMIFGF